MSETHKVLLGSAAELFEIFARHERDTRTRAQLATRAEALRSRLRSERRAGRGQPAPAAARPSTKR